jgi:hypothetical protein
MAELVDATDLKNLSSDRETYQMNAFKFREIEDERFNDNPEPTPKKTRRGAETQWKLF